ncbi:putative flippase GtrA [Rhizobium aquaticum]|uniref:Flippase GtrA n=1 Tax=Rhizobium aquaticum TaxID=1549636 RepID=A0ABV2IYM3_9HYPH
MKKLLWFAFAGGTGFLVDAGSLSLILWLTPVGPYIARVLSIAIAMAYTWTINRTFTFGRSGRHVASEGMRYGLVGVTAALVNYGTYSVCLMIWPPLWPVAAAAIGSGVAMVFSYLGYSRFVFGK